MSIKSHAFGGITLTDDDAKKFRNQVLYGKPKQAAQDSVKRGVQIVRSFQKNKGKVIVRLHAEECNTMTMEDQIRKALARGYCHPDNSHKELDAVLIEAMTEEVVKTLTPDVQPGHQ